MGANSTSKPNAFEASPSRSPWTRPPTSIELDAALHYLDNHALLRQDITPTTARYALADMCLEMRDALTKRTTTERNNEK